MNVDPTPVNSLSMRLLVLLGGGALLAAMTTDFLGLTSDPIAAVQLHQQSIVPRADTEVTAASVGAFCAGRIATYKIPKEVTLVDALPRNANGKVLKTELRAA